MAYARLAEIVVASGWMWFCAWVAWLCWTHDQTLFGTVFMLGIGIWPLAIIAGVIG